MDNNYANIPYDNFVVQFWDYNAKIHPENTSCYVEVKNMDVLYKEQRQFGVIPPNGKLEDKPQRMQEFATLNNYGNMTKFGQKSDI